VESAPDQPQVVRAESALRIVFCVREQWQCDERDQSDRTITAAIQRGKTRHHRSGVPAERRHLFCLPRECGALPSRRYEADDEEWKSVS
jgi:hypothetical protein